MGLSEEETGAMSVSFDETIGCYDDCPYCARLTSRTKRELNVDLLDKTMSHIETVHAFQQEGMELEQGWNQGAWCERTECGTSMCFAGWAVELSGIEHEWKKHPDSLMSDEPGISLSLFIDGKAADVSLTAERLLGLNGAEGARLFLSTGNDIDLVREAVKAIKQKNGVDDG
jgi:hypothetical protein